MAPKDIYIEKPLWFGWVLCQYWPGEIILKHPSRKRGIYIKAPWYRHSDKRRWEGSDGKFYFEHKVNPKNERGFRPLTIESWDLARRYSRSFTYTTRYGAEQTSTLTARRERSRSVLWCLRWLPFAGVDVDGLNIEFSDEMGSERGSWKGGCIGTSCTMQPGESVDQCIDRFLYEAQNNYRWDR